MDDLLTVALHEVGHIVGLDHQDDIDDVMYELAGQSMLAMASGEDEGAKRRRRRRMVPVTVDAILDATALQYGTSADRYWAGAVVRAVVMWRRCCAVAGRPRHFESCRVDSD